MKLHKLYKLVHTWLLSKTKLSCVRLFDKGKESSRLSHLTGKPHHAPGKEVSIHLEQMMTQFPGEAGTIKMLSNRKGRQSLTAKAPGDRKEST